MSEQKLGRPRVIRSARLHAMMVRVDPDDHETLKKIAAHYEISVPELCRFYLKLGMKDAHEDGIVSASTEIPQTKWYIKTKSQKT